MKCYYYKEFNCYKSNLNQTWKMINKSVSYSKIDEVSMEFRVADR